MPLVLVPLFAYFISFHVSVAGMEIFLWIVLLIASITAFRRRRFIWPQRSLLVVFSGLLFFAVVSYVVNQPENLPFLKYIGQFRWILTFILLMQFFNNFNEKINYRQLICAGQVIVVIAGFYSIYQFFTAHDPTRPNVMFHSLYGGSPYFRPNSFFGLPTTFAYVSAMFFSVSFAFLLRRPEPLSPGQKWVERLYMVLSPLSILIAFTRTVWFAFVVSGLAITRMARAKHFKQVMLAVLIAIATLYVSFSTFRQRLDSVFDSQYVANYNRIYLWKANLMIFKDHPLWGYGFGSDKKNGYRTVDSYLTKLNQPGVMRNHPHNTYLNYLASMGFFGALFFYAFLFLGVRTTWRGYKESKDELHKTLFIGTMGVHVVMLLGGLTECAFEDSEMRHQYFFYLALQEYLYLKYVRPQVTHELA